MNFIQSAFQHLFAEITGLGGEAWDYLKANILPTVEKDAQQDLAKLAPIAEQAVLQLATTGHVSNDKRNLAVAQLKGDASAIGLDVANGLLNLAVEVAYNKLNSTGQLAAASSPTPAPGTAPRSESVPATPTATN